MRVIALTENASQDVGPSRSAFEYVSTVLRRTTPRPNVVQPACGWKGTPDAPQRARNLARLPSVFVLRGSADVDAHGAALAGEHDAKSYHQEADGCR
jgi:hypothetical protein